MGEEGNSVKLGVEQESNVCDVFSVLNQKEASTRKEGFASKLTKVSPPLSFVIRL